MNGKQIGLGLVLADFAALTAYAVWVHGFVGLFEQVFASPATMLLGADLVISLSLVSIWLWQDARRRGISAIPYLAATAALGSVGPLLYLIRINGAESRSEVGAHAPARTYA